MNVRRAWLAGFSWITPDSEKVILDLEGQTKIDPKLAKVLGPRRRGASRESAKLRRAAEERGGLPLDDLKVLIARDVRVPFERQVEMLPDRDRQEALVEQARHRKGERGVDAVSRRPQERELAETYDSYASACQFEWPRVAVNQVSEVPRHLARAAWLFFTDRERLVREGP